MTKTATVRGTACVIAAVLCTAFLAGCGSGLGGAGNSNTLRIQAPSGEMATAIQQVANDFEKANPGTTVSVESLDSTASRGPNISLLSSTATPDIGYIQRGTGVWSALLKNHQLASLDDVWAANKLDQKYSKSAVDYYTTSGHHYGVLFDQLLINPVYYNVDTFTKAGISLPSNHQLTSVAQLDSIVAKLKAAGYGGLGVAGASPYDLGHTLDALLPTSVSTQDYQALLTNWQPGQPTTVKYTDPGFVNVLRAIANWQKQGIYQDGMLGMDVPQVEALFTGGKIGMLQGGNYTYSDITQANPSFQVGWFLLPPLTAGGRTPFDAYTGDTLVIPAKAAHPALAKKFLEFFMTDKYQAEAIPKGGELPAFENLDPASLTELAEPIRQMLQVSKNVGVVSIWDTTVPATLGQTFEVPLLQKLVGGSVTPAAAAAQFQTALENLQSGRVAGDSD